MFCYQGVWVERKSNEKELRSVGKEPTGPYVWRRAYRESSDQRGAPVIEESNSEKKGLLWGVVYEGGLIRLTYPEADFEAFKTRS